MKLHNPLKKIIKQSDTSAENTPDVSTLKTSVPSYEAKCTMQKFDDVEYPIPNNIDELSLDELLALKTRWGIILTNSRTSELFKSYAYMDNESPFVQKILDASTINSLTINDKEFTNQSSPRTGLNIKASIIKNPNTISECIVKVGYNHTKILGFHSKNYATASDFIPGPWLNELRTFLTHYQAVEKNSMDLAHPDTMSEFKQLFKQLNP